MHGQRRTAYKARFQDPQVAAGLAQKAQQWNALNQTALQQRLASLADSQEAAESSTSDDGHSKTLLLLDKMLRVNPDPMHLWNHRRELLGRLNAFNATSSDYLSAELALTAAALERNPKSYGAWFHRKWCLQQSILQNQQSASDEHSSASKAAVLLKQEVALTEQFLMMDERNFHCWNYRRFLVGVQLEVAAIDATNDATGLSFDGLWPTTPPDAGNGRMVIGPQITPLSNAASSTSAPQLPLDLPAAVESILQREWTFSKTKIVQNFSNGSAFHYRSKLLLLVSLNADNNNDSGRWCLEDGDAAQSASTGLLPALAMQEWKLMENIIFTEPDDQTIWWYHRFVLDWVNQKQQQNATTDDWYGPWLQQQAETLEMLLEDEPQCKWAWLGYHWVLTRRQLHLAGADTGEDLGGKIQSVLDQLLVLDPDREQRYFAMKNKQTKAVA